MRPDPSAFALAGFLLLVLALGLWRTGLDVGPYHVERAGTGTIVLEGRIVNAPEIADTSISYTIGALAHSGTALAGKMLVRDRRMWPRHAYGETVRLTGKLEIAEQGGYGASLRSRGIQATMFGPRIETMEPAPLSAFGTLTAVREAVEGAARRLFPEPQASLAVGLLTGTRASFPAALTEDLRTSGLTHIVAISGSNVAIVLALMETLCFWIPRRLRLWPLIAGIAIFVLFTGTSASVVRAGIMGGLGVMALHAGRVSQARRTVLWTAGAMLLWNPLLLTHDLGFQLSFLSVLGILEVSPYLEKVLSRVPNMLALRESIALTLSSQIAAAPWIAYALGNFSLVALPANLLAAPLIPWAMLFGALAVALSPVGLGLPMAFAGDVPLSLIISIAEYAAALPHASVDGLSIPGWAVGAYYVFLVAVLSALSRRSSSSRTANASSISPTDQLSGVWGVGKVTTVPSGNASLM